MQIIGKYECKQFSYHNYFSEDISIMKKTKSNLQVRDNLKLAYMSDQNKQKIITKIVPISHWLLNSDLLNG